MKKDYQKPMALIQELSVGGTATGACSSAGAGVLNFAESTCYYVDDESGMVFFSKQCDDGTGFGVNIVNPNPRSPFAQLCYHRPLDVLSFFSS